MREERKIMLRKIVNGLRKSLGFNFNVEKFEDRIRLQKYVFLLRKFGIDLGYNFDLYVRGPYSRDLSMDYYSLPDAKEEIEIPEEFVNLVRDKDIRWLELSTSLIKVRERYPKISDEEVIEIVEKLKLSDDEDPRILREIFRDLRKVKAI